VPDLRPCLYWEPTFQLTNSTQTKNLNLFSSDDIGKYWIDVFGISVDGKVYQSRKQISISSSK
jgi:hypothetical protein